MDMPAALTLYPAEPSTLEHYAYKDLDGSEYDYYRLKDDDTSECDYFIYKIRVDSDEGRAYAKLSLQADRLQYMRLHNHEKMGHVSADLIFFQDEKARIRYSIRTNSPEYAEVTDLIGDSDEDFEEGTERMDVVLRYFKEHAHELEVMSENGSEKKMKSDV